MDTDGARMALDSLMREMAATELILADPDTATYRVRRWIGWWQRRVARAIECLESGDAAKDGEDSP